MKIFSFFPSILVLIPLFYSCAKHRCSDSDIEIQSIIRNSEDFKKYAGNKKVDDLYIFPKKTMLDFSYLNRTHGSFRSEYPDDRFTREAMKNNFEIANQKNHLCLCECASNNESDFVALVTPWIDDLAYAIVYNQQDVKIHISQGFRTPVDGAYIDFLFKRKNGRIELLHPAID